MSVNHFYLLVLLSGLAASGLFPVSGLRVETSGEVEAVNGTDVWLKCTFQSSSPITPATLTVSWSFRPIGPGREESVFYYHERPYPPPDGRFHKRAIWAGDIMGRDATIVVRKVKFTYNGTFSCQVKNPPDVHGNAGEVKLTVVTTASFSEMIMLAVAIGGAIVLMVIFLVIIMSIRRCREKRREEEGAEELPRRQRKDPTVCHPARAIHLYVDDDVLEVDSSDGMISEASTKDPSSSEEDDRSSDYGGGDDSD
ncbi:myelin protein zero-like protein 2 [Oncorhynchus nerka]|uniref:myelin protein zero-like protein 2 n=1 Tax=Oncorhynchus nerka TaxID=8023 RepID=UPI001131AE05|nr:myelin protein zero-like protein 2 [Oncorhynchus nerka]